MFSLEDQPSVSVQGRDIPEVIRLGDILRNPIYGKPAGSSRPVLLLAAGQRIETVQQLQRLQDAGFRVSMPGATDSSGDAGPNETEAKAPRRAVVPAGFAQRLEAAQQLRSTMGSAVVKLLQVLECGGKPDLRELVSTSTLLVREVAADPYAVAALTHLRQYDDYTAEHSADVAILMVALGRTLGYPEEELRCLALTGLVHDVGKQRLPLEILNKQGPLSPEEWVEVRKHPEVGHELLLASVPQCPAPVLSAVLQHHERLDGSGYPYGLSRKDLHPYSLIAAVADVFDATTADRPYRPARPARESLMMVYESRGASFDPQVAMALIKLVGVYPVGTRVKLDSGEVGVVVAPNPDDTTRPVVEIHTGRRGQYLEPIQLSLQGSSSRIVGPA